MEPMKLPRFARTRAARLLTNPAKLGRVLKRAQKKRDAAEGAGRLRPDVLEQLGTLLRLLQAWMKGDYPGVPRATLVLIAGAVVYFLMPFDLVSDFIVGLGLMDDASVILWVVSAVKTELEKFLDWERRQ